jgi:4-amino-4-deoxy-L-arabinose transferase-like glycosyltransferase
LWSPVLRGLRHLSLDDQGVRFCLAVLVPALLVFSLISGKQPKYLLPLVPVLALLSARALAGVAIAGAGYRLWPAGVLLVLLGIVLSVLPWWPQGPDWREQVQSLWGPALLAWSIPFFWLRPGLVRALRGTVLAMWLGTLTLYLGVVDLMAPRYRLGPLAVQLADLQRGGHAIAWLGKYHGQFQFLGRLQEPVQSLPDARGLRDWLAAHPRGYVLVKYPVARPEAPPSLSVQPYRGGSLVLWPAQQLLQAPEQLDALAGNA